MNNATQNTKPIELPARCAFKDGRIVIAGTPGSWGDAGWSMVRCRDAAHMRQVMADYPTAAMPCWRRLEARA
jgi:hypothetical protein